jgi:hypothetical protein
MPGGQPARRRPIAAARCWRCRGPNCATWLSARGESWIEDPSNAATKFERTRWRETLAGSGEGPAWPHRRQNSAQARDGRDRAVARWMAAAGRLQDEGYLTLELDAWTQAAPELRVAILRRALSGVGGLIIPGAGSTGTAGGRPTRQG